MGHDSGFWDVDSTVCRVWVLRNILHGMRYALFGLSVAGMRVRCLRLVQSWRRASAGGAELPEAGSARGQSPLSQLFPPSDWPMCDRKRNLCFVQAAVILYFLSLIAEPNPDSHGSEAPTVSCVVILH